MPMETTKERQPNTPLAQQTFGKQLNRVEKLLTLCGEKSRQKLILKTLLDTFED
jgi:hypothetical protein